MLQFNVLTPKQNLQNLQNKQKKTNMKTKFTKQTTNIINILGMFNRVIELTTNTFYKNVTKYAKSQIKSVYTFNTTGAGLKVSQIKSINNLNNRSSLIDKKDTSLQFIPFFNNGPKWFKNLIKIILFLISIYLLYKNYSLISPYLKYFKVYWLILFGIIYSI